MTDRITGAWLADPRTQEVFRILSEAGHQVFAVGGCVRNDLMGLPIGDIDFATDAAPEKTTSLAEAAGFRVVPTGIEHGTVTVLVNGASFEITTFRRDVETDGRRAVVSFSESATEDAHRRDFTMNALYCRANGHVVDPLNGILDIKARRVRFIDDPEQRIREDYLRILRFFRFHALYGDPSRGLDPDGLAACAANSAEIVTISKERIGAEMRKLLGAADPAPSLAAMEAAGVLHRVLVGAGARTVPLLVHFEQTTMTPPDAMRRLVALGGGDPSDALRLSRAEAREVRLMTTHIGSELSPGELGYRLGFDLAKSVFLLQAAIFEQPPEPEKFKAALHGAAAKFPVRAADLSADLTGPALGRRLKELEQIWIRSGFSLTREQLLAR